jgi:autophagy-related protein 9
MRPGSSSAPAAATDRLDAHDIANRIMREENYLVALFNKEILDLRVPLPPALQRMLGGRLPGGQLTRALEWNLRFCLLRYLFGKDGQVRRAFVSERYRGELIEG